MEIRQDTASLAPTKVETTMPTLMPTWNVRMSRPRVLAGASSATDMGTVWVAPPTAKPSSTRAAAKGQALGATAQTSAPRMKTIETSWMVRRRPWTSDNRLHTSAPVTAPSRMPAAITCSMPLPMRKSSLICRGPPSTGAGQTPGRGSGGR